MTPPPGPHVLLAPDKFKGTLTAAEVAAALSRGIAATAPAAVLTACPIADGGEGTVDAALAAGGTPRSTGITGPTEEARTAHWALGEDGTAVLELAQAVGLQALPRNELAPWTAGTRGLGELIAAAVPAGARTVVVGLGGSASTDAGAGLLQGLGAHLRDAEGAEIGPGPAGLAALAAADLSPARAALDGVTLICASDVTSPLLGPEGATAVFGPQKGLADAELPEVEAVLVRAAAILDPGSHHAETPGAGAAGGTGFALMLLGAEAASGADVVLDLAGFDTRLAAADVVITGEGKLDRQTLQGKGPAEVARRAVAAGLPVIAVAGTNQLDDAALAGAGITAAHELLAVAADLEDALARPAELLEGIGREIGRSLPTAGDAAPAEPAPLP